MPEEMVHEDINAGRLVQLKLPDWQGGIYNLQIVYRRAFLQDLPRDG